MKSKMIQKTILLVAISSLVCSLGGCGSTPQASTDKAESTTSKSSAKPKFVNPKLNKPKPEEEKTVPTHQVGELVKLPSADFTVKTLEQRDVVESEYPDMQPNFVAGEGKRLWYFEIEWTNNTNQAVSKECHGPDMFDLRVFDVNGVEMLKVDQPGMIVGNNCTTGLLKGETGRWLTAFTGLDADFGWAVFQDYAGDAAVITLDPNLKLKLPKN